MLDSAQVPASDEGPAGGPDLRVRASSLELHDLEVWPSVPDKLQDIYRLVYGLFKAGLTAHERVERLVLSCGATDSCMRLQGCTWGEKHVPVTGPLAFKHWTC